MEITPEDKKKAAKRLRERKYYAEHKEYFMKKNKKYRSENSESIKVKKRKYWLENSEIGKIKNKKYREDHTKEIKIKCKEYRRNRRKNDPIFKMVCYLRNRIYRALKSQAATKDLTTKELFGADQEFVWKHLESQFREGMTRKNNNSEGWHIDHIKPMNSFDLKDPEQLKECCHYTNLQPLWWWENLEKGDKIV